MAFGVSLCSGSVFHQLFVGFDYELNPQCDLYFNLFFNLMDYAWQQGAADIVLGQTSDTFKMQKLNAYQVPHIMYSKKLGRRERRLLGSEFSLPERCGRRPLAAMLPESVTSGVAPKADSLISSRRSP